MLVYAVTPEIEAMTRRNVETLLANTTGEFELRVLFNGGPPMALEYDERLTCIYQSERSSIAHAYNLAFSCATGDYFAGVHNDVSLPEAWNEPLVEAAQTGVAFPGVLEDARECAQRGVGTTQPTFPPGCCFVMRKALYEALGGFDERYEDCHFEDTDLWMRVLAKGEPLTRAAVTVWHGRARTRTSLPDGGNTSFRRNKQIYIDRHARPDGSVPLPTLQEHAWQSPSKAESDSITAATAA